MINSYHGSFAIHAENLRRLMAREGLTLTELMLRSRLNHRTLKEILAGRRRPQPRTLHRLAESLNVPVEELFQDPALLRHRLFDRRTNPAVDEVVTVYPQIFHGWAPAEFDELYSRFGTGGSLTQQGALDAARAMNHRRELLTKATLLLESNEGELLESILELLHRRVVLEAPGHTNSLKPEEATQDY
ncbi:MAG TPA: helix-turn-helix transcriptional regulator [Pirellulales bacterium]|nr:helix-turn-helix transcriptional regulator [Pirellulales bacterium]